MEAYIYDADIYCGECINEIKAAIKTLNPGKAYPSGTSESLYDSGDWPKGPYSDGGGAADCPQHCGSCGEFLENPLTSEGYAYVREHGDDEMKAFYDIEDNDDSEDDEPFNYHHAIHSGLDLLREIAPESYQQIVVPGCGFSPIPSYAEDDGPSGDWWKSEDAESLYDSIMQAIVEHGDSNE